MVFRSKFHTTVPTSIQFKLVHTTIQFKLNFQQFSKNQANSKPQLNETIRLDEREKEKEKLIRDQSGATLSVSVQVRDVYLAAGVGSTVPPELMTSSLIPLTLVLFPKQMN